MDTPNTLSLEDRKKLTRVVEHTVDDIMPYYVNTIRAANRRANLSNEKFWTNLYIDDSARKNGNRWEPSKIIPLLTEKITPKTPVPEDPYLHMDIQLCSKYLIHGPKRVSGWKNGMPLRITDSDNFYQFIRMGGNQKAAFVNTLYSAIDLRNNRKHETMASYQNMSLANLSKDVQTLSQMMEPFRRLKDISGGLAPVQTVYDAMQSDINACLGGCPVSMTELSETVFSENAAAVKERTPHIRKLLSLAGFRMDGDFVIADCPSELLTQAIMIFTQKAPGEPSDEDVARLLAYIHPKAETDVPVAAEENAEVTTVTEEIPAEAAAAEPVQFSRTACSILEKCGKILPMQSQVIEALLSGFHLMADESIFLCTEGRQMLMDLLPILKKLGLQIQLDYSVIAALYLKYRGSKSLPTELLQMHGEDPDLIHQQQEELHANCKMALKALRRLRENNCMVSVTSPVPSCYSYENIHKVAESFPNQHFFVLSMQRQLAEELADVPGKNAVVAKVTLDGKLLLLGETYPIWQTLLGHTSTSPAAQPLTAQVPVSDKRELPKNFTRPDGVVSGLAKLFSRLDAVDTTGAHTAVTLQKKLGEGGEGAVYETTHPDGLVAKIYHRNKLTHTRKDKLLYMVNHNPQIPNLAWPCAMLYTQDQEWVGYLMTKAPGQALEDVVFHPGINWVHIKDMGWSRRHLAQVGANIAHTFAQMHQQNMLMGDVNPRNIMVNQDCSVYFVDCDSYQFGGYECPVGKPDYTPPEVHVRMRTEGVTEYRYTRTEYNEVYSLAVLLFSILLPGKAPYAARNAGYDDVVDAVIAGYFPYPYGGDENPVVKGNMLAPAGVFRNIWSCMTYQMKTHFYETFTQTGEGRRNAQQWEDALREYIRQIELNHSTDELEPTGYKDISREGSEASTKMIDRVCSLCGQKFNIAEDVYHRRQGRFDQDFCGKHYEMMRNFRSRTTKATCSKCGSTYQTTMYDLFERDSTDTPLMCDNCENITVTCYDCGATIRRNRQQVEDFRRRGKPIFCRDCFSRRQNG